jgi:polysaccharide biosynthesis protein PelA
MRTVIWDITIKKSIRLVLFIWLLIMAAQADAGSTPSIAFYYADHVPAQQLAQFDRIVVEAEHVDAERLSELEAYGGRAYAYVSVGEAESWRSGYKDMRQDWFIGRNTDWKSDITDLANPEYREFLIARRFQPLRERGFRAFFLDTLDSYQGVERQKRNWHGQEQGLVDLVRALKSRFPDSSLLVNRGFQVIPQIKDLIDGVVLESLFRGWNPRTGEYHAVSASDRKWAVNELVRIRDEYGLPVYAIDYVPAKERNLARETAGKIAALGIGPWVAEPAHDVLGVGSKEVLPRRVLLIYDGTSERRDMESLAVVLDYFGYVPVYQDVQQPLPSFRLAGRFAGVVSWLHQPGSVAYEKWLVHQVSDGLRLLMLGHPGVAENCALIDTFGLASAGAIYPCRVIEHDAWYGFEARNDQAVEPLTDLLNTKAINTVHVRAIGRNGVEVTPVVTGPWGGVALDPWLRSSSAVGNTRWIVDPFALIKTGLALPDVPMPDVTTENGHRLWMAHIDGDGFLNNAERPGTPFAAEVIRTQVLEKYLLPTTVSVIEGEIGPAGLYPQMSPELEPVARAIFRLPTVEIASHTYSHPFDWNEIREGTDSDAEYSLPIPGYRYSVEREIIGSAAYIDKRLAPAGKHTRVLLWSGNCLPHEKAIAISRKAGLYNLNGGETTIRKSHPFLSLVTPMTRPVGSELQVYAPIMNENVYTNLWQGPFYGFRRVIETFELTDRPRRLKPIDIYYHFYSGAKTASLRALDEVYTWTLKQEILPVFISDYIKRVQAFQQATVAREMSGSLCYQAPAELRTLRLTGDTQTASPADGENVAGYRHLTDGTYYALAGAKKTKLSLDSKRGVHARLVRANGVLDYWQPEGAVVRFSMHGHQPLEMVFDGPGTCRLTHGKGSVAGQRTKEGWFFRFGRQSLEGAVVVCR